MKTTKRLLAFDMESFCHKLLPFTSEQCFELAVVAFHMALRREKDLRFEMPSYLVLLLSKEETARRERADHELSKERVDQTQSKGMAGGEQEADENHEEEGGRSEPITS